MSPLPSGVAVLFVRLPESYPPPSREAGGVAIYRYRGPPFRDGPTPNRRDPYYYNTVTVLRGAGLKHQLSRDRVVKSPPLPSNVEDTQPLPAVSDGGRANPPGSTPSDGTLATAASASSRTLGLVDAVAGGETEDTLSRLAGFRSQIRGTRPVPADHSWGSVASPLTADPPPEETSETRPITRSQTNRETLDSLRANSGPYGSTRASPRYPFRPSGDRPRPPSVHLVWWGAPRREVHVPAQGLPRFIPLPPEGASTSCSRCRSPPRHLRRTIAYRTPSRRGRVPLVPGAVGRLRRRRLHLGTRSSHRIQYRGSLLSEETDTNSGTLALGTPRQRGTQELDALDPDPVAPYTRHEYGYRMLMETRVTSLGTSAGRLGPVGPRSISFLNF